MREISLSEVGLLSRESSKSGFVKGVLVFS